VCACVLCVSKGVCDYMCQCVYDIFFTGALISLFLLLNTMIYSSPTYLRKNNNNNNNSRNKIKMKVVASNHTFHSKCFFRIILLNGIGGAFSLASTCHMLTRLTTATSFSCCHFSISLLRYVYLLNNIIWLVLLSLLSYFM
jgi:hypothetical protein